MKVAKWPMPPADLPRGGAKQQHVVGGCERIARREGAFDLPRAPLVLDRAQRQIELGVGLRERRQHRLHQVHVGFGMIGIAGLGRRGSDRHARARRARRCSRRRARSCTTRSRYHSTSSPTTRPMPRSRSRASCLRSRCRGEKWNGMPLLKYSSHSTQPTPRRPWQHAEGRGIGHDGEVGRAGHLRQAHAAAARERRERARVGGIERRGGDVDVVAGVERGEERRHRHRLGARGAVRVGPGDAHEMRGLRPSIRSLSSCACRFWSSVQRPCLFDEGLLSTLTRRTRPNRTRIVAKRVTVNQLNCPPNWSRSP